MSELRNIDEALGLLKRAVDEKGRGHVYTEFDMDDDGDKTCFYRNEDGEPSCIIGHVASYIGSLEQLREGQSASSEMSPYFTPEATEVLQHAQGEQDAGYTWGHAYDTAMEYAIGIKEYGYE